MLATALKLNLQSTRNSNESPDELVREAAAIIGLDPQNPYSIPFACGDATVGSEIELQAGVEGGSYDVDLPIFIRDSDYYRNVQKHDDIGDMSRKLLTRLDHYLDSNGGRVWENSWVRFRSSRLNSFARAVLEKDLRSDKSICTSGLRGDTGDFIFRQDDEEFIRIPVSYLIKLSLCDALYNAGTPHPDIETKGMSMAEHFLNDNTSPETFSFHVGRMNEENGFGEAIASETAVRFLLCSLLVQYANLAFGLKKAGQRAIICFSPLVPQRQKYLNDSISDSYYRELFMSPCLSGWDIGEKKKEYMSLCHMVLSRSRLNALYKLREAGIIANDLVVLPKLSNTSLSNNGIHISIGSRKLNSLMEGDAPRLSEKHEKAAGDLVIKIFEHFLPLFPGLYSASPYRMPYEDFRPENALSFLPHELDYTHLRMIWRRWRKKSANKFMSIAFSPSGESAVDRTIESVFKLKGDYIPDFRVIDYLASLLSTEKSSPLNGIMGSEDRLRRELEQMGVFSSSMSLYLLYKLRVFGKMGFSGYEGRFYSLFHNFKDDMKHAANLQMLITSLAYLYIAKDEVLHSMIPDTAFIESERRQIFYSTAIGIKSFNVHSMTPNGFMKKILSRCKNVKKSKRYPGYNSVGVNDYLSALTDTLETDGRTLIDAMGLQGTIDDLRKRIECYTDYSAAGKLTRGIIGEKDSCKPLSKNPAQFNAGSEKYYREVLRGSHIDEGMEYLIKRFSPEGPANKVLAHEIKTICGKLSAADFISQCRTSAADETLTQDNLAALIHLIIISETGIK
jgi:hypothetical protein